MKAFLLIFICSFLCMNSCNKAYQIIPAENPNYLPNEVFQSSEDLKSPIFRDLVTKYSLDTIFHGETDEFKRILLIRHWIKSVIRIDDHGDPYPGNDNPAGILDAALKGQGFHCGHFMIVQNAIMNAFGYVTRTLGAGPGVKGGPDGHHGINEIWSNQYNKWFLSDAKYDHHFEKDGIPLSALEIRDEYLKNTAADILKVKGPDRIPTDKDSETGYSKVQNAQTYTWIEWHGNNDLFTAWPNHQELLVMYNDDYFKNHTWIWDDKPHWAYDQPEFMKLVDDRDKIYWTPNTIFSTVTIEGKKAHIELNSQTPNLKEYQILETSSGNWHTIASLTDMDLKGSGYEWKFRAVNLAGVAGPEHRIIISSN